jgi:hypothetical protein
MFKRKPKNFGKDVDRYWGYEKSSHNDSQTGVEGSWAWHTFAKYPAVSIVGLEVSDDAILCEPVAALCHKIVTIRAIWTVTRGQLETLVDLNDESASGEPGKAPSNICPGCLAAVGLA